MLITIDGGARTGKTTISRRVSERLRWPVLETGPLYRAATALAVGQGLALSDGPAIAHLLRTRELRIGPLGCVLAVGLGAPESLRTRSIDASVSAVSANPEVRVVITELVRRWCRQHQHAIVEGRDIGTVVFPEAECKVFLVASQAAKAARDANEESGFRHLEERSDSIQGRDRYDSEREVSPLRPAVDALVIDTTGLSLDAVEQLVLDAAVDAGAMIP